MSSSCRAFSRRTIIPQATRRTSTSATETSYKVHNGARTVVKCVKHLGYNPNLTTSGLGGLTAGLHAFSVSMFSKSCCTTGPALGSRCPYVANNEKRVLSLLRHQARVPLECQYQYNIRDVSLHLMAVQRKPHGTNLHCKRNKEQKNTKIVSLLVR